MEENKNQEVQEQEVQEQEVQEPTTPSIEEVMARASQAEADAKKWKNEFDKQSSQIASLKKTVQSLQTAEQRKESEDKEAREAHDAEFARLQNFERKTLAEKRYILQGMSVEMAEKAAKAEVEGDMDALANIQAQHTESTLKNARAAWQKSIPQPNFGTGEYSSMSKNDILAIKDTAERQKAILANRQLFGI